MHTAADEQVRDVFEQSYLDEDTLADIWCVQRASTYFPSNSRIICRTVSDIDEDGMLDVGEFVLAMHLIAQAVRVFASSSFSNNSQ